MSAAEQVVAEDTAQAETVAYPNGKTIAWTGKKEGPRARRMQKDYFTDEQGVVHVLFYFRWLNPKTGKGEFRDYPTHPDLKDQAAGHGFSQKYGDEVAGVSDPDDILQTLDELHERVASGKWESDRAPGTGGNSLLAKAMIEYKMGKDSIDEEAARKATTAFLATLDPSAKTALQDRGPISVIYKRLQEEKQAKQPKVDVANVLANF